MTTRQFLIVARRGALGGRRRRELHAAVAATPALQARATLLAVDDVHDLQEAAARVSDDTVLVAAGGDGTVNMLVTALWSLSRALPVIGVLPLGTGNAFAHAMGVPAMSAVVAALLGGHVRVIDLMETTHPDVPVALMSLSVGIEARFIRTYSRWRTWGRPLGMVAGTAAACSRGTDDVTLTADGHALVGPGDRPFGAGLYNTRCYAYGRVMFPDADPGDGQGEAVVYPSARSYLRALLHRTRFDANDSRPVVNRWRRAQLDTTGPIQVDGESRPGGAFEIRLVPGAVRAIAAQRTPTSGAMFKG